MPPLAELDDEDDEDARTFSRFQRESSSWLVFSGVLALLVTLFITSFTANPLQPRVNSKEMARLLQQVNGQLHVMLGEMSRQGYDISSLQLDLGTQQEIRETFVTTIRDVWVPTLCYSSLIISLLGAMVCLQIKHWLMRCTMRFFPLSPAHPDPSSLRAAALRFVEYKKSRAETVARTKRIVIVVPPLMYGAAAMFACGVAAKIGSFFWIAIA
ncbi:uncharacterized protein PHACADRAFT_102604 [Phanerochaete carnosa HHB-10118-sp]|uniref:DUF6535 domain-containing protein n=1 Tax=Phanerochaete carnosa (strain HHB-10118-sp) TaxID=650164 RepID=K5VXF5_PHACS|nr:uncharacterized protein PHACADRAFT_102604 [Phanerochaete carnosa HHB-10118-sp]EKM51490.1 hypothetical protein PHACADRAFT_102604 [Phanerochaete carnosa HHB-10118-sp]